MSIVLGAYDRVNSEFNKMMSTLLPESEAKLVLVNPNDLAQGLNVSDYNNINCLERCREQ